MPSVVEQTPYNEYAGDGVATVYPYEFQLLDADDLVVKVDGVVVPSSDFTLAGVGDQSGGDVTFDTAPAADAVVLLSREIALEREIDYQNNGDLRAPTVNLDFNRLWQAMQGVWARVTGGIRAPYPEQLNELPAASVRALKSLAFDAVGQPTVVVPVSGSAADVLTQLASTSYGDAGIAVQSPLTGSSSRTQHDKNRDIVSIFDCLDDDQRDDVRARAFTLDLTATITAFIANGGRFFVPVGGYGLATGFSIPANVELIGEHQYLSEFKHVFGADGNWISINGVQNVHVRNMRINGNQAARSAAAGFAIAIYNTETTATPRRNNCSIEDCWVDSDGFTAIFASNAHDFQILRNRVTGTRDSGIAACVGCSSFLIEGNFVDGFEFQISASSDGNADYATTGAVRDGVICNNVVRATKAGSNGLQFDGIQGLDVHDNMITLDGGDLGIQLRFSTGTGTGTVAVIDDCQIHHNTIVLKQDITTVSVEISGTGDIRSSSIDHNVIKGAATKVNTVGFLLGNGVKVRLEENRARNIAQAVQIDTGDVASAVEIIGMVASGCTLGVNSPASYANKCDLSLIDCSISGSSTADYNLGSGINLTSRNTVIAAASLANVNIYKGDLAEEYAQQTGATYTVRPVDKWLDANRAGTITYTLPSAATYAKRELNFRTIQAQTVVSASSNVVTQAGGGPGTAILAATAGKWARLVSDGTNWQIMESN